MYIVKVYQYNNDWAKHLRITAYVYSSHRHMYCTCIQYMLVIYLEIPFLQTCNMSVSNNVTTSHQSKDNMYLLFSRLSVKYIVLVYSHGCMINPSIPLNHVLAPTTHACYFPVSLYLQSSSTMKVTPPECSYVCTYHGHKDGIWDVAYSNRVIGTASAGYDNTV